MKKNRLLSITIITMVCLNIFAISSLSAAAVSLDESNANVEAYVTNIKTHLIKDRLKNTGGPLLGNGYSDTERVSGNIAFVSEMILTENMMAAAALSKDYLMRGDTDSLSWVQSDIYQGIKNVYSSDFGFSRNELIEDSNPNRKYAVDQFMFLEFMGETFRATDDANLFSDLEDVVQTTQKFKAEVGPNNYAEVGAYYTLMDGNTVINSSTPYNAIQNPYPFDNDYPLINTSLWAAAGLANYATIMSEKGYDEVAAAAVIDAENAMKAASLGYAVDYGMFEEYQTFIGSIYTKTQALAILAYARLYTATGKQNYVIKADQIINSLFKYCYVSGFGGFVHSDASGLLFSAYDNALLAYALSQLGIATGGEDKTVLGLLQFTREPNKYLAMAQDIMAFMNTNFWLTTVDNSVLGYAEWIDVNGEFLDISFDDNTTRLTQSNMLALYSLDCVYGSNKNYVEWYSDYLLYLGVALAVVVMIIVLVSRKRNAGTKLPKVVKGLLGDD